MKGKTMQQLDLFEPLAYAHLTPADNGCVWWAGNWECRNWNGWFQSREGGRGNWRFQVPWFGLDDRTCSVYAIAQDGTLTARDDVPIDSQNRILIDGKRYSRDHWCH